jgi:fucose permease
MTKTPRTTLAVACAGLFVVGVVNGALGPLIPLLAAGLSVPVEALGATFAALFVGAVAAQVAGGWLNERVGLRNMVLAGLLLLAAGVLGIAVSPTLPLLLVSAAVGGLGQGAVDVGTNVLVPTVCAGRKAVSAVNLLHFAYGAGAMVAPVSVSAAAGRWGTPMPALLLCSALALATLALGARLLLDPGAAPRGEGERVGRRLYRSPALWLLAVLVLLCIGGELGVGGWTTVYLERTSSLGTGRIALVVSAFWLALTAGRLMGAWLGTRVRSLALLGYAAAGCVAGALLVLVADGGLVLTVLGTLLIGASYGPIVPTAVVVTTERFPSASSPAVSVIIAAGSLGGMLVPPLQGVLLARVSPLASAALVAGCAVAMLAAVVALRRGTAPRPAEPAGVAPGAGA